MPGIRVRPKNSSRMPPVESKTWASSDLPAVVPTCTILIRPSMVTRCFHLTAAIGSTPFSSGSTGASGSGTPPAGAAPPAPRGVGGAHLHDLDPALDGDPLLPLDRRDRQHAVLVRLDRCLRLGDPLGGRCPVGRLGAEGRPCLDLGALALQLPLLLLVQRGVERHD